MVENPDAYGLTPEEHTQLFATKDRIAASFGRLREIVPCMLDMSAREATLSSAYGHTVGDKIELHRLAREFGFADFGLPNFFDFPSVSDQFLDHIIAQDLDRDQFLVTVAVEPGEVGAAPVERPAIQCLRQAGLCNVILLIEIRPATLALSGVSREEAIANLARYVSYFRTCLPAETARQGRIYVRIADIFDAFDEDPAFVTGVLKVIGRLPTSGILFEDVRGTRFPFETAELVQLMRHFNPPPRKVLAHPHSGNGMEDAATIAAVLAGADGIWAGFTPQAAQGAHGSSMMFLVNLLRAGNPHVPVHYRMETLKGVAETMWGIQDRAEIPPNQPLVGRRAYRYVDDYFIQKNLPCDLDPQLIGVEPGYEITPAWAPVGIIGKRLAELGYGPEVCEDRDLLYTMRQLINRSQMDGKHVPFDHPDELARLLEQSRQHVASSDVLKRDASDSDLLTLRYR